MVSGTYARATTYVDTPSRALLSFSNPLRHAVNTCGEDVCVSLSLSLSRERRMTEATVFAGGMESREVVMSVWWCWGL